MSGTALRRIFWPVNSTKGRDTPGWVVGWMNSANDYFVFAILDEESVKVTSIRPSLLILDRSFQFKLFASYPFL
jgi:hypothetical protein